MLGIFKKAAQKRESAAQLAAVKKLGLPYDVAADGEITIKGDVDLSGDQLTTLPDLSFATVEGNFNCSNNRLKTLAGAPKKVTGSFDCSDNRLDTLEGGPAEVCGDYRCARSLLENLTGAPREVGSMDCSCNLLSSLRGAPEKVAGDFNCDGTMLSTLAHAPREVGGDFICTRNQLCHLIGGPAKVGRLVTDMGTFRHWGQVPLALGGLAQPKPARPRPPARNRPAKAFSGKTKPSLPGSRNRAAKARDHSGTMALAAPIRVGRPLSFTPRR